MDKCRDCGCTDEHACLGGCYWVEPNLCSACWRGAMKAMGISDYMLDLAEKQKKKKAGFNSFLPPNTWDDDSRTGDPELDR